MCSLIALFRRAILLLLVSVPLVLALPAWAQAPGKTATRASNGVGERAPVRVGVSGPFSGPSAPMGLSMREGIRIAAAEINAGGGVLGRRLELVERDDEASNELGAQIVRDFVNRERIVAGLGIVNTGVALASQRHYQSARIPVITSVATGTLITRQFQPPEFAENYVFRVSANDTLQAEVIVDEAVRRRGFSRLAILHDATNYGVLGSADLAAALRLLGIEPVVIERFHLRQTDMRPHLERARTAGAQAVLTYGIGPELAHIANGMARMGWQVPIVGSWTLAMSNFIEIAGRNAEGARMPQTFIQVPHTAKQAAFLDAWRDSTGTLRIPVPPAAAQGYDSMLLLAAAIRQAGSLDGARIRDALENLEAPVEGVVMTYHRPFSTDNHETLRSAQQIHLGEIRHGEVVFAREATSAHTPPP
ncbi:ABC transporter substrate-binding protein [Thauera sp.]|jgi:branched-chain amino acid transport system substrate-binding protein|uniref:ABC transporter substrate-binding protein n=1 Tax=Thauera sp. TaxID=1905334 RepID=UPI002A370894|nr:ABC transporter substrate-binding protein [Thauera sp.]MDX9887420.1 ABC transporter substrate-binding protein [Thauera sp.]